TGTAAQCRVSVKFVRKLEDLLSEARNEPALILLDLNNSRFDAVEAIERLKADESSRLIPITGFLSHVQVDLKNRAEAAGCDTVMPRSEFSANLGEILSGEYNRNEKLTTSRR